MKASGTIGCEMARAWRIALGVTCIACGAEAGEGGWGGAARAWWETRFGRGTVAGERPFSFRYGGCPGADLLSGKRPEITEETLAGGDESRALRWVVERCDLEVVCEARFHAPFSTVEWVLRFANRGGAESELLEMPLALDAGFERGISGEFLLRHARGSSASADDYRPMESVLGPGQALRFAGVNGRPTGADLPFFNIGWGGRGVIVALGWPGQWCARLRREGVLGLRVEAGQEELCLRLRPGEEIRTPLVAVQFWEGDWIDAQNRWRRWMLERNVPRAGDRAVTTHLASTSGTLRDAAREIALIDAWATAGIALDYWIIDAGWYPHRGGWFQTGTWEVDRSRFPLGLREVGDRARRGGARFVVWFEPERVTPGTWLWENRADWLLEAADESGQTPQLGRVPSRLLDLGNARASAWLAEHVSRMIEEEGIDVYREDFNIEPLAYWRARDGSDRAGITENRYVTGHLAYWDELRRRHPRLWIDTCASGGRRNDLETLRRSVPLLRSDWFKGAAGQQCQSYGISLWLPVHGTGCGPSDPYRIRSSFCPMFRIGFGAPDQLARDAALVRRELGIYRKIEPYLTGDFYPLTPYALGEDVWMAWQYDRPGEGAGVVQAFRREACDSAALRVRLRGLEPGSTYRVTDVDGGPSGECAGRELMGAGWIVRRATRPAAVILLYRRVSPAMGVRGEGRGSGEQGAG